MGAQSFQFAPKCSQNGRLFCAKITKNEPELGKSSCHPWQNLRDCTKTQKFRYATSQFLGDYLGGKTFLPENMYMKN